ALSASSLNCPEITDTENAFRRKFQRDINDADETSKAYFQNLDGNILRLHDLDTSVMNEVSLKRTQVSTYCSEVSDLIGQSLAKTSAALGDMVLAQTTFDLDPRGYFKNCAK